MRVADFIMALKPYEGGKPIEEIEREYNISRPIKLASNENPLGPSERVVEVIRKIAGGVNVYPDGNVYYLRRKLSSKLGVSPDNLVFGNGSDEIIELIYRTFATGEDDEVVYCFPTFIEYRIIGMAFNKRLVEVPLKGFAYDVDAMMDVITDKTRLVFLNVPNNPTGTILSLEDIVSVVDGVSDDTLVVIDEAYHEYAAAEGDYPDILDLYERPNVIILRTFSKAYALAGLRIGYGIASKEIVDFLNRTRPPFNVNLIAQVAAMAALDDEEHLRRSVEISLRGKDFLYNSFKSMGLEYVKSYANFVLVDVGMEADECSEALLRMGVIIRSMKGYGFPNHIRVTVGTPEENEIFIDRLRKVIGV